MPEELELELELVYDESYGELLNFTVIDEEGTRPLFIGKLRHKGVDWLAIHRMYVKGSELRFGKGVRICIDSDEGDLAILAIQAIALEGEILEDA